MAEYLVTTAADESNGPTGGTSLREAIAAANANPGRDTIVFDPALAGATLRLTQGELVTTDALTLNGDTDGDALPDITLSGDALGNDVLDAEGLTDIAATGAGGLADNSRILNAPVAQGTLIVESLRLTGGRTTGDESGSVFDNGTEYSGGAIRAYETFVTLRDSVLAGNSVAGTYASGGAVFTTGFFLRVENSRVTGNAAEGDYGLGGGLYGSIRTAISGSEISHNRAKEWGGGVYSGSSLTVTDSLVTRNRSEDDGGGLHMAFAFGVLRLVNTTVSRNLNDGPAGDGGGVFSDGAVLMTNSAILGNATLGDNSRGGGISAKGPVNAVLSTIAGNSTSGDGSYGGGIFTEDRLTLIHSTLTGNSTAGERAEGGGFEAEYGYNLLNSIIFGNVSAFPGVPEDNEGTRFVGPQFFGENLRTLVPEVPAQTFAEVREVLADFDGDGVGETPTGVFGGVPRDNGGPVPTVALRPFTSNPAIDTADPTVALFIDEGGADAFGGDGIFEGGVDLDGNGTNFERLALSEALLVADIDGDGMMTTTFDTAGDLLFDAVGVPDLGATEAQLVGPEPAGIVVTTLDDVVDAMDMQTSLREAIAEANARPGIDLITFAPGLAGGTIRLEQGALVSTDSLIVTGDIDGDGSPDITITGDARDNDVTSPGSDVTDVQATLAVPVDDNGIDDDGDGATDEAGEDLLDDNSRIFELPSFNAETTLDGLILTGGRTTGDFEEGGAINTSGQLTLTNTLVAGNSTGGEYARAGALFSGGVVNILRSTFSGNETHEREAGGGAVVADILSATDSLFTGNGTFGGNASGGAILARDFVFLADTEVSDNVTHSYNSRGGGVYAREGVFAKDSIISGNMTMGDRSFGGGIGAGSETDIGVVLTGTTVHGNGTRGIAAQGGGIYTGKLRAVDTTISDNFTTGDANQFLTARGGGFFGVDVFLLNTTVAGNFTSGSGASPALEQADSALIGGPYGHGAPGGGGYVAQRIEAIHSTFTGNSVSGAGIPLQRFTVTEDVQAATAPGEFGGGAVQLAPVTGATAIFTNSIVLGSLVSTGTIDICIDELAGPAGAFHFRGQNIVGPDPDAFDPTSANPMIGSGADNVINANPNIVYEQIAPVGTDTNADGVKDTFSETVNRGVLADNEGQVQTVALLPGNQGPQRPAIDSADRTQPINLDEGVYLTDFNADGDTLDVFPTIAELRFDARQDYFSRDIDNPEVVENSPDLGAFEVQRPPEFTIAAVDAAKQEGDSGAVEYIFEITRTVRLDGPVSVDFEVTGSGAAPATASDFLFDALPTGTVEFEDLQETATVTILGETDTDAEPDEGFTVTLTGVDGDPYGAGVPGLVTGPTAEGTILNDDALPPPSEVSIAAVEPALPEGDTGITFFPFLITRTGDTSTALTVDLAGAGSGANPADQDDFTGDAFGTVSLPAGTGTFAVIVGVNGDTEVEPDEEFTLTLSNLVGNGVLTGAEATGTILNDDAATGTPTLSIAAVSADRAEGDTGTTPFVFLVSRTGETGVPASVDYAAIPQMGDGADPDDFAQGALPSGSVSFAAGETTRLLVLDVAGDTEIEADEGFAVTLSNPGGGAQIGTASAAATIRNDDAETGDRPPVTEDDYVAIPGDAPIGIDVLADDVDPEGGPLTLGALEADPAFGGQAENGTVTAGPGDQVTYTPDQGFNGVDSFSYEAVDAAGNRTSGEVVVQVGPPPPPEPINNVFVFGGTGDDIFVASTTGTMLTRGGNDTFLISQAVQPGQTVVFDDSGDTTVELAEATQIVSSLVAVQGSGAAIALTLRNGAQVQILTAEEHVYEVGANATTGDAGTELGFEAFVTQVLGTTVPAVGGISTGGFVEIGPDAGLPGLTDPGADGLVFLGETEADGFVWG